MSLEVRNRGISGPTNGHVSNKNFLKKKKNDSHNFELRVCHFFRGTFCFCFSDEQRRLFPREEKVVDDDGRTRRKAVFHDDTEDEEEESTTDEDDSDVLFTF